MSHPDPTYKALLDSQSAVTLSRSPVNAGGEGGYSVEDSFLR